MRREYYWTGVICFRVIFIPKVHDMSLPDMTLSLLQFKIRTSPLGGLLPKISLKKLTRNILINRYNCLLWTQSIRGNACAAPQPIPTMILEPSSWDRLHRLLLVRFSISRCRQQSMLFIADVHSVSKERTLSRSASTLTPNPIYDLPNLVVNTCPPKSTIFVMLRICSILSPPVSRVSFLFWPLSRFF
jgi:hypothetical protein